MAEIKWIKLSVNMFNDEKIKLIRKMPEGTNILLVWIYLLTLAGKTNASGYIFLAENIPYSDEMLASIMDMPLNVVRIALKTFSQFGMLETDENNLMFISNWEKHQNIDGMDKIREQTRQRVAKHRAKKKELEDSIKGELASGNENGNVDVTLRNAIEEDIEEDKDIDIDIDKDIEEENNKTLCMYDENLKKVSKLYEQNIGVITPIVAEQLIDMSKNFQYELIEEATKIAVNKKKRYINYILGILNNWKDNNLLSIEALEAHREEKKQEKEKKQDSIPSKPAKTRFHNFEQRTSKYTPEQLEAIVRKRAGG